MDKLRRLSFVFGLTVLILAVVPAYADGFPWTVPVGERIVIREYPDWPEGGPNGVLAAFLTDSSVWWILDYMNPPHYRLVRHSLWAADEEEFPFDHDIQDFAVTPDDDHVFYTSGNAPSCVPETMSCIVHWCLSTETHRALFETPVGGLWSPDIDEEWLVWERSGNPHRSYLMNWREDDGPVLLGSGRAASPRIFYPWVVWDGEWSGPGAGAYFAHALNLESGATRVISGTAGSSDVGGGQWVYAVGEYLLTDMFILDLNNPQGTSYEISWDNGGDAPRIHSNLVVWQYYDGATGRSAIQGRDLDTGLTFDIGVRGGMHSYDVRNHIVAWADRIYYPEAQVFIMLTRPYPLRGDMNGDNVVDVSDIMLVASHWRDAEGDPGYDKGWDLNWDGRVDVVDIMLVVKHWGECLNPSSTGC